MKFGSIAVGFLIAVALGGIYVLVVGPGKPVGDDDPIVVAGGSFEIGSLKGFNKDPGGDPNKAIHTEPARYLNRVEVLYNKPAIAGGDEGGPAYAKIVPDSQKSVTIDIDYCPNKCVGTANDVITFNANLSHQNLGVANSDKNRPIGKINQGSKKLEHVEAHWQVSQISVTVGPPTIPPTPTRYPCDNGRCQVVLHYCSIDLPNGCQ